MVVRNLKIFGFTIIFLMFGHFLRGQVSYTTQDSLKAVELFRTAIDFARNEDPEKALEFFNQSLHYRKKIVGEKHYRLGGTYMNMALQYKNLHRLEDAYIYYKLAEEMYQFNLPANDSRLGDLYSNIGNYFRIKGNFSEAIRYQEQALYIYDLSTDEIPKGNYISAIYNLADVYHLAGRFEDALNLVTKHINKGTIDQKIQYRNLLASIYNAQQKFDQANEIHREIIKTLIHHFPDDKVAIADQYSSYAQFLEGIQLPDSALAYLLKAEAIYKMHPEKRGDLGDLFISYARVYAGISVKSTNISSFQNEKTNLLNHALSYFEKALYILNGVTIGKGIDRNSISNSNFPVATLLILQETGDVYMQLAGLIKEDLKEQKTDHLENALMCYDIGGQYVEYLRTSFVSEESKLQFTSIQQNIFKQAVKTSYELYMQTGDVKYVKVAFANSERNKAASLFDQLSETRAREISHLPDTIKELEHSLTSRLAYYKEKLFELTAEESADSARLNDLKSRIFETEQKWNDLRYNIEKNHKEYFDLKYNAHTLTIREVQKILRRNEVLVTYTLNYAESDYPGELYVITLSKDDVSFTKQLFDNVHIAYINSVYSVISDPDFLNINEKEFGEYTLSAHALFNVLLAPIEKYISEKKLIIVPSGILNYLPFEALLTEKVDNNNIHFHDLPYFILRTSVNYAYSAALFRYPEEKKSSSERGVLAVAPEYAEIIQDDRDTISLPQLPGTKEEVNFLATLFKTTSLLDKEATEHNFRNLVARYDILHLAMHTLINDSLPMYSRLAFYQDQPDSLNNDGWLNTSDIYNLQLNARMAVLSSCRSGSGILRKGEGLMSLARGFFYAGCPSVVLTLWEVEDKTGTAIMKEFYRNLKFGKPKDVALRNAKLKYLSQADPMTSHPHFWLGYITVGDPDPLFSGKQNYLLAVMIFILFWMTLSLVFRKKVAALWLKTGAALEKLKNYSFSLFKRVSTR